MLLEADYIITILTVFVVLYREIQARGHDIPPRGQYYRDQGLVFRAQKQQKQLVLWLLTGWNILKTLRRRVIQMYIKICNDVKMLERIVKIYKGFQCIDFSLFTYFATIFWLFCLTTVRYWKSMIWFVESLDDGQYRRVSCPESSVIIQSEFTKTRIGPINISTS